MFKDIMILWFTFFYVGIFTIGGGYVMLPLLEREIVDKHKWLSHEELIDVFALGQSTPGIIAINVATFVGVKKRGVIGGIFATFGMVLPSLLIIIGVAHFLSGISNNPYVIKIFVGIRAVVAALLIAAVYRMSKRTIIDYFSVIIMVIAFITLVVFNVGAVYTIVFAGIAGIIVNVLLKKDF